MTPEPDDNSLTLEKFARAMGRLKADSGADFWDAMCQRFGVP
jgi:hypothetical protein